MLIVFNIKKKTQKGTVKKSSIQHYDVQIKINSYIALKYDQF